MSWRGGPVAGARAGELLAVLAQAARPVSDETLARRVWSGSTPPLHPTRALQVLVSRLRTATAAEVVVRAGSGYALGLPRDQVDCWLLADLVDRAAAAESEDPVATARLAQAALALAAAHDGGADGTARDEAGVDAGGEAGGEALADLRAAAWQRRRRATALLGRARSAQGDHAAATALLTQVQDPDDPTLLALLRSESVSRGVPAALTRYAAHREHLRDTLGVDPGPELAALHAALLAADRPVRDGVRFDVAPLVGREDDLRALTALMARSRVTSVLGPGGLGKTRLAHLVARAAEQPVVQVVELVGVTAPEDVVAEVGSALGVRDSVVGRRALDPGQQADLRARISVHLARAPTLLVLDNCEHVVAAVADLVAFLVATVPTLRVLTTTRAPLAIAAERVFALGQLGVDDAVELFGQRARAARPGVRLDPDVVRRVVTRLDGLPLAIELAAARTRVMSIGDIDRRLDDRFALLRGGDRSAPDRHQTLLAVIDWSWQLLAEPERRALRRLSVFADGFSTDAAHAVLGSSDPVERLVDQSLLGVVDEGATVRHRMLETVREFARAELARAGESEAAADALAAWACDLARTHEADLFGPRQVEALAELAVEENNLADVLREAITARDRETVVSVLAGLATYWTIRGEHDRVVSLWAAVEQVLEGWAPPPELVGSTVLAGVMVLINTSVAELLQPDVCRRLVTTWADQVTEPRVRAMARVVGRFDARDEFTTMAHLEELYDDPDRLVASMALQWSSHAHENDGDTDAALDVAARALALWRDEDGIWSRALLLSQLAGLNAQVGSTAEAAAQAGEAIPLLDRLGARDDAVQARCVVAAARIRDGELDRAQALLDEAVGLQPGGGWIGGSLYVTITAAELALARGRIQDGLADYLVAVEALRDVSFPGLTVRSGLEPWVLFGECAATVAFARHGSGGEGDALHGALLAKVGAVLDPLRPSVDIPVAGTVLFALGTWGLARGTVTPAGGVRLLALAHGFVYSRFAPSMAWPDAVDLAERSSPGLLATILTEYADRRGPDLLEEARAVVAAHILRE